MKAKIFAFIVSAIFGAVLATIGAILLEVKTASAAAIFIGSVAFVFGTLGVFSEKKWAERLLSWLVFIFTP